MVVQDAGRYRSGDVAAVNAGWWVVMVARGVGAAAREVVRARGPGRGRPAGALNRCGSICAAEGPASVIASDN